LEVNEPVLTVRPDDGPIGPKHVALYVSLMVIIDVFQGLRLSGEGIKRSSDFCYMGSIVAENGGTSREVNARIQKARGSFSKLRRVWLAKSLRKDTKIRIFKPLNAELIPICYLLALLGAHHFLHVSRMRVKSLTFMLLMSYIYIRSTYS